MSCAGGSGSTKSTSSPTTPAAPWPRSSAARFPHRIRTLTLTNCDVHDNFPPEPFEPFVALAQAGELGPMVAAMAGDLAVARSEVGFAQGYAHPETLPDELLASYLGPFVPTRARASSASSPRRRRPSSSRSSRCSPSWMLRPRWRGARRRVLRAVVGRAPAGHDPRRRAGHPRARCHAVLARREGGRPRPPAPGLLGGAALSAAVPACRGSGTPCQRTNRGLTRSQVHITIWLCQ